MQHLGSLLRMEDLRCTVESQLHAQVGSGLLDRDWWVRFLQVIGGTEQEAQALLEDQGDQISVKQFLDFLFGPDAAVDNTAQNSDNTTQTDNLKEYFENHYVTIAKEEYFAIRTIRSLAVLKRGHGCTSQLGSKCGAMPLT